MRITLHVILLLQTVVYSFTGDIIRQELQPLDARSTHASAAYREYLRYYGLDTLTQKVVAGTFKSDSFVCVGQVFTPEHSFGTVFFQHGLFDHSAVLHNGIAACLKAGFTVAVSDMPGHGLSSGEHAGINSFTEYAAAFTAFYENCRQWVDTPLIYIGHSTGCAVGFEYVAQKELQPFAEIIFLAPLARSAYYHLSLIGNAVMSPFTHAAPRWHRTQSHDAVFTELLRNDPFQAKHFPLRWAKAYFAWWQEVERSPAGSLPLTIIQGTSDGVVDWRYNMRFYRKKVIGAEVHLVKNGRHQLLNESPEYRSECLRVIGEVLSRLKLRKQKWCRND